MLLALRQEHNSISPREIIIRIKPKEKIISLAHCRKHRLIQIPKSILERTERIGKIFEEICHAAPFDGAVFARLIYHWANLIESHFQNTFDEPNQVLEIFLSMEQLKDLPQQPVIPISPISESSG